MTLISDILLAAGAFGAAIYCYVLSGRLKKLSTLESGMGGAIAVLSAQVDDMTRALDKARSAASGSAASLDGLTARGEAVAARIELLLASMHDLPAPGEAPRTSVAEPEADSDRKLRFIRRRSGKSDLEVAE